MPTKANLPRALPLERTKPKAARIIRRGVAFGSLVTASSVWLALRCVHAGEAETLQIGQARHAPLRAGQRHAYPLPLAQRDCAFGKLDAHAGTVLLRVLALESRQRELRKFTARAGQTQPLEFEFCVEAAGTYELELTTPDGHARYKLQLEAILGRNSRSPAQWATLANTLANPSSPRLRTLQAELLAHPHDTADFWREVDASGTPLREPIDRTTTLVTFLYRAGPPVEHVAIDWGMWTSTFAQREFSRLPESDVWWRSVTLPNATRLSYQLAIDAPRDPSPEHALADRAVRAVARADPRNEAILQPRADLDAFGQRSLLTLSAAPAELTVADQPQPWPRSRLQTLTVGSDAKHNAHRVSVFLPRAYSASRAAYPLVIVFDGEQYVETINAPAIIERLSEQREITPLIAAFVHNRSPNSRAEELPCNPAFAKLIARDLLTQLRARYRIASGSRDIALLGSSFGGLASNYIALEYPNTFGKVLSQSGSYWWNFERGQPAFDGDPRPGWLGRRFRARPHVNSEFYLSAGSFEVDPSGSGVLESTRAQRDVLRELGYSVAYQEFVGGHDVFAWRATLPDALRALFRPIARE